MRQVLTRLKWRFGEAAESACRVAVGDTARSRGFGAWNRDVRWRRACFAHDPQLGWRFIPGLRARVWQAGRYHTVRTDSHGFRNERESGPQESGRFRIVVLGDSYAAGDGVNNPERFTDLLEKEFSPVDLLNLAMPGSGPDQQVLTHEHVGVGLSPNGILFCPSEMDIFRLTLKAWPTMEWGTGTVRYRAKPYFTLDGGSLELRNVPAPKGTRTESELGDWGPAGFLQPHTRTDWERAYAPDSGSGRLLVALIGRLLDQAGGRPVILAPLPSPFSVHGTGSPPYDGVFRPFDSPEQQCFFADLLPAFRSLSEAGRKACFFDDDPHFTPFGHRVVATALADAIRRFHQL
jgi:hypothetical protein